MRTLARGLDTSAIRALADPVRARICELLAEEELCVCHLTEDLGISQPLLSHHMKALREAGLVQTRRHSYWIYYRLVPERLVELASGLHDLAERAEDVTTARACGR